jgi:protein-tyrosine phosphatase
MAEGLFKKLIAEKLGCSVDQLRQMGYKISSAGTIGVTGWPASSEAVAVSKANGVDIREHSSSVLTEKLIRESDLIYAMSRSHLEHVERLCRDGSCKGVLLAGDREVPDPIGQDVEVYKKCFAMIEESVAARISEFKL